MGFRQHLKPSITNNTVKASTIYAFLICSDF